MDRRNFLGALVASGAISRLTSGRAMAANLGRHRFEILSLQQIRAAMDAGKLPARWLTQQYLDRIAAFDHSGPSLRSVLVTNPDALTQAEATDSRLAAGEPSRPLEGVSVLLKDCIDTGDGMPTTAGSLALAGTFALEDAFVVQKLRSAGAIILGKTNLSEWANFRGTRPSSGWSAVGGQTLNPYDLSRSPGGSSSGSAAAVAANFCTVAIGTETSGSITGPASCCSVVGLKPTVGLISRRGIVPISFSQDTAGPLARSVDDLAAVLGALTGEDPEDPATAASNGHAFKDYTQFLDADGLKGARIGVARQFFGNHREVNRLMSEHIALLRELGAEIVDPVSFRTLNNIRSAELEVLLREFKVAIADYLATRGDTINLRTLADLIAFNREHADEELALFGQETFLQAQAKGPLTDKAYFDALERCHRLSRTEGIDAAMAEHRLDAIIAPTLQTPPWTIDHVLGDHYAGGCAYLPAIAGYPHLSVPAGYVRGLPVGLSFFGMAWSEPALISMGYAFERAARVWRPPALATADVA